MLGGFLAEHVFFFCVYYFMDLKDMCERTFWICWYLDPKCTDINVFITFAKEFVLQASKSGSRFPSFPISHIPVLTIRI